MTHHYLNIVAIVAEDPNTNSDLIMRNQVLQRAQAFEWIKVNIMEDQPTFQEVEITSQTGL